MRLKLCLLLVLIVTFSWSQTTQTFTVNGTFPVPAGITSINVQAWGGGGSGGGASGAPLLLGRGAAGGGGGAYASAPVSVIPGSTLNVVVAGQTPGTSGNGAAGGNSTISGFESSILAAGGSGGAANNAGGTPAGGIGGTVAASVGSTKFAGANGGNGNSWNLLGLLLSSGAGGNGANSGGAGGAAVSGLILSNAAGNTGSAPGGAGSGAINSAAGAAQTGGAGAAGKVIISYTCPSYSIGSVSATGVCASVGSTSTVTVTSLPVGNYVVTYNTSSPSATGLTANLAVTSGGTGTFTATGLTTIGSSTITITNISSGTCSSAITANNTVTIEVSPATVGGAVTGGTTINAGSMTGLLTLSGNTGSVLKWQRSVSPFTTWVDISGTANVVSIMDGPLTETTQYRAVVQSGSCSIENSASTTVTVNPRPTINLLAAASGICSFGNPGTTLQATLGYAGTTGSPTTYSIVWNSSPPNSFSPITNAALPPSPITLFFPGSTAAGTYTGTLTVKNANGAVSSPGKVFTVTINNVPTITTTGTVNAVTTSSTAQTASLPYSASTLSPVRYNINWNAAANAAGLADQSLTNFAFASGGGVINTINVPANVPAGTYSGLLFISNNTCENSYPISLKINAPPTITLASSAVSRCSNVGGGPSQIDLDYTATTGNPTTYSIVWNSSPANSFVNVTDAALAASPITIDIPDGVIPATYTGNLTVKNADGVVSNPGLSFTVTINETPSITSTGVVDPVFTSANSQNATLAYSAVTGNPTEYYINWSTPGISAQGVTPFAFSPGGGVINNIVVSPNVTPGTYYGELAFRNANCGQSQLINITVNPVEVPTINLESSISVCSRPVITNAIINYSEVTESPVTYSIVWNSSPANNFINVTDAALPPSPITISIPAFEASGTYTGVLTVKNANGAVSTGSTFTVVVHEGPQYSSSGIISTTCASTDPQFSGLDYDSSSGNIIEYTIDWNAAANNAFLQDVPFTSETFDPNGGTIQIPISANALPGNYSGSIKLGNGECLITYPISITIIGGAVGGSVTGGTTIASGSTSGLLTLSGQTGTVVNWESSVSPFTEWTEIENTEVTYTSGPLTQTTQFRAVVRKGLCPFAYSQPTTVTVEDLPTIELSASTFEICSDINGAAQNALLDYFDTTGNPTTYSIVWNPSPANSFAPVTDAALSSSPISIVVPAGTIGGTYTGTLTVKNANGISSTGHAFDVPVIQSASIITDSDVITSVSTSTSAQTTTIAYTGIIGNPTSYSLIWDNPVMGFQINHPYTFSPSGGVVNDILVPANVPAGTYTGQMNFYLNGCYGTHNVSIVITPAAVKPTITLTSNTIAVCGSSSYLGELPYTETTGEPVTYSLVWSQSPPNNIQSITDATLPASPINFSVPVGTADGAYQATLTVKNENGDVSDPVVITANIETTPNFQTEGDISSVTTSASAQTTTLAYDTVFANPLGYSIDWNAAANAASLQDQPYTPFDFSSESGTIDNILVSANALPGTYSGTLTVRGAFCGINTKSVSIVINPAEKPTITLTSSTIDLCSFSNGSPRGSLPYSSTTENPTTYSIVWNSSPANNLAQVTDEVLPADQITLGDTASTDEGTYTGTLTVKNANGAISSPIIFTLNLGKIPVIDSSRKLTSVTSKTTSQTTTLPYAIVQSGNPTEYRINWNDVANAALLQDQGSTPFSFNSSGGTIDNIVIPANVPAGTYNGDLILRGGTCEYSKDIFIIINASGARASIDTTPENAETSKSLENQISVISANKVINIETQEQNINKVFVYDVSGDLVYKKDAVGDSKLSINNLKSNGQVLVVKVILDNNQVKTKKIIY